MKIGINAKVDVEVLRRGKKDTNSAPQQVIELLEEYIRLREQNEDDILQEISDQFKAQFSLDDIKQFLENPDKLPKKQRNLFATELKKIGYDINYRKYLRKYNEELVHRFANNWTNHLPVFPIAQVKKPQRSTTTPAFFDLHTRKNILRDWSSYLSNDVLDEFAILIDRDMQTHSESNMFECIKYCRDKGYRCYIANPCFEFWLLMHLSDVKTEFGDRLDKIKENKKVSEQHTFVSKEVSDRVHHGKSGINFIRNYLPYIDKAVIQAKKFPGDENELVDSIGCNLWRLIEELKMYGK